MNLTFVKDNGENREFIRKLFFQYKTCELKASSWSQELLTPIIEVQFNALLSSYKQNYPNAENYILLLDNQRVGWLLINKAETYHLVNIIIHNNYQNKKIGTHTLCKIIEEAQKMNKKVTLAIHNQNYAKHLYKRLGFVVVEEDKVYTTMVLAS